MARQATIGDIFVQALDNQSRVTAQFIKRDGDVRTMDCRWPTEGKTFQHGNITVWDIGKNGYRNIRPESLVSITVKK